MELPANWRLRSSLMGCVVLQQRPAKAGTRLSWTPYRLRCSATSRFLSRSPGSCHQFSRYPIPCNNVCSSQDQHHPRQTLARSYNQSRHDIILAAFNVTIGSTCHHSAASQTQRVPRDTTKHNREKTTRYLPVCYNMYKSHRKKI